MVRDKVIETCTRTGWLFRELLEQSLRDIGADIDERAEAYLVLMLDEMSTKEYSEKPLGVELLSASGPDRCQRLRETGDSALFVSGFFEERLRRIGATKGYYAEITCVAYGELASVFGEPFSSLSSDVPTFQRALKGVREAVDAAAMDLMDLYGEWLKTRSPVIERRLAAMGALVGATKKEKA